jgi:hypothetical protein
MPDPLFELVSVPSGAISLRSLEHGETFHPGIGPIAEARVLHVSQHALRSRIRPGSPFIIWDIGLGAGANALAVIEALANTGTPVRLLSFDQTLEPLRFALQHAGQLEYLVPWKQQIADLLATERARVCPVDWTFHAGDFRLRVSDSLLPAPNAILFDPYSPASNPSMWARELFQDLRQRAADECTLTTYSRSTVTRVNLLRAGWCVGRGAATGEKTETTVAATSIALLEAPLRSDWLERVRRSTASGLREFGETPQEIGDALAAHPQMQST